MELAEYMGNASPRRCEGHPEALRGVANHGELNGAYFSYVEFSHNQSDLSRREFRHCAADEDLA